MNCFYKLGHQAALNDHGLYLWKIAAPMNPGLTAQMKTPTWGLGGATPQGFQAPKPQQQQPQNVQPQPPPPATGTQGVTGKPGMATTQQAPPAAVQPAGPAPTAAPGPGNPFKGPSPSPTPSQKAMGIPSSGTAKSLGISSSGSTSRSGIPAGGKPF